MGGRFVARSEATNVAELLDSARKPIRARIAGGIMPCYRFGLRFMPPRPTSGLPYPFGSLRVTPLLPQLRHYATIIPPSGLKIPRAFSPANSHRALAANNTELFSIVKPITHARRHSLFIIREEIACGACRWGIICMRRDG